MVKTSSVIIVGLTCAATVCCAVAGDASQFARTDARCPVYAGPVTAQEVRVRAGVGHFMEKVKAGKEVTVAYLGGSITAMDGWRNLTTDWLRTTYPQAKFKEIHASIGGTGSNLGVFRVAHGGDHGRQGPTLAPARRVSPEEPSRRTRQAEIPGHQVLAREDHARWRSCGE